MIGAIIGDIVGSRFERANHKSTDFELFTKECHFTDDGRAASELGSGGECGQYPP